MAVDTPGSEIDESIRARLLHAATELFARKGYAATTVREIVAACDVTKPVLYYHFGSKEGIYAALMQDAFTLFDRVLHEALSEGGSARQRVERVMHRLFWLMLSHIDVLRVIHSIYYGPPQGAPFFDFDAYHRTLVEHLHELVEEGMRAGEFRLEDPAMATWALVGALSVAEGIVLGHQATGFGEEQMRRVLGVVFEGVLNRGTQDEEQRR